MRIYVLNVGELIRESDGSRFEALLSGLDEVRREKALSARTPQARAAGLGAGLLLQRAVRDWQEKGSAGVSEEGGEQEQDGVSQGELPRVLRCTVSGLFSELPEPLALTYRCGAKGKPYFQGIPLYFSLSHSGEYVLCAVSCREVGADIQKIQPADVGKLAKRFFSGSEYLALERCGPAEERQRLFFELWSRKEAYGKLTGEGAAAVIGEDMESVREERGVEWMEITPPEGYAAAVCRFRGDLYGTFDEISEGL